MLPFVYRPTYYFTPTIYQLATALGLVSVTFFFGALILAFALRIEQEQTWMRFDVPLELWLSTALLLASSCTLEASRRALRRAWVVMYRGHVAATLSLALLFLFAQFISAADLVQQGVTTQANPLGSAFYLFVVMHAAHIGGGIAWLSYLYVRSRRLYRGTESDLRHQRRITVAAAMYWHFMGALWLVLFYFLQRWTT